MKFFTEKPETSSKEKVLDIKTLLKLARQYIDDNNVKKAQQCCKKVLRKNSQNYMALVLLGKSYGRSTDASSSYEKAIELKPDNPLAWQGLVQHYEAKDDESGKIKLLSIYDKILTLDIEEDYAKKTLTKIGQIGAELKNNDTISSLLSYIKTQNNQNLIETAKIQLIQLLQSKITCKDEDKPDIILMLKNLDNKDLSEDHSELVLLGELILQDNDFTHAVEEIIALEIYPHSSTMKIWLCKHICEIFLSKITFSGFDIDKYMTKLVTGIEDTKYGGLLIAITYYTRDMFEEAYQKSISVIQDHFDVVEEIEALFIINCTRLTPNISRTKNLCNQILGIENLNDPFFIVKVNEVLLLCYAEEKDFNEALNYLKKIPVDQMDSFVFTKLGNLFLEQDIINDKTWKFIHSTDYFSLFRALNCLKHKRFSEAIDVLMPYDKHPLKYYYLALTYWFVNLNDESLENFLKAAELIPDQPTIYYCLGVHYFRRKDNIEESRKYFEKSYELCKKDVHVVKMLSVVYSRLGLVDLEFDLLKAAFLKPETCNFWICKRLARLSFARGIKDEALIYLDAALSMRPQDVGSLQLVGDINFSLKEYNQALSAYNKVLRLSRNKVVFFKCLNNIGSIYSEQSLYQNAIFVFDKILDNDPGNVAALKGITENRIIFALKHVANNAFQNAREQMQLAVNRITAAMSKGIKHLGYWLLYGDILVFMTRLPNEYSFVNLQTSAGEIRKEKIDMYKMAIQCYSNTAKFRNSSALFKCALVYFEYYCETKNIAFCKASYNLAVLFMKVHPNVWPNWDLLGKTCYHLNKRDTAYYCFSKAVSLCEDSEFKVWSDLSVFYLKLDKHQLARYRHVIERFDLTTFAPTWVKEHLSETISNHNENSETNDDDQLSEQDLEKLQFTQWARTFQPSSAEPNEPKFDDPIAALKIIPNAFDIVEWYLCFEDEAPWVCGSLGNLKERKGLLFPALKHFHRASELAQGEEKKIMLSHKGRILMKMQKYAEAVNVYNQINGKNLQDTIALAQALFKINNYERSYACYDKALCDLCRNDDQRVSVLISMSNVAYRLHGLPDGARLLLRAVCMKFGEVKNIDMDFWKSYVFKRVDVPLVAHIMSEHLHKYIDKTLWWYYMGLNYLRGTNNYSKLTRACIKRAIRLNNVRARIPKLYALFAAAQFYSGNRQSALQFTTRVLKLYPFQPELWAIFILCIYSDRTWPRKAAFLRVVIGIVRKFLNVSDSMNKWLIKVEGDVFGRPRWIFIPRAAHSNSP